MIDINADINKSFEEFESYNPEAVENLRWVGFHSCASIMVATFIAANYFIGWNLSNTLVIASIVSLIGLLLYLFSFAKGWFNPGGSVPIWYYGQRKNALFSACWTNAVLGAICPFLFVYLNKFMNIQGSARIITCILFLVGPLFFSRKLAILSSQYFWDSYILKWIKLKDSYVSIGKYWNK